MEPAQENQLRDRGWAQPSLPVPVLRRLAPFYNRPMRWGEVACALTHRRAWLRVLEMGPGPTLILEDDALPAARAGPLLSEAKCEACCKRVQFLTSPARMQKGSFCGFIGMAIRQAVVPLSHQIRRFAETLRLLAVLRLLPKAAGSLAKEG
eukprot:s104_g13.t1